MPPLGLPRLAAVVLAPLLLGGAAEARPAPAVQACLAHAAPTLEDAVQRLLDALGAGDVEALRALTLSAEEFERAVWPWLPASDPRTNLTADFVWGHYATRNEVALRRLVDEHAGVPYRLVAVEPSGHRDYPGFQLVVRPVLVVEDPSGARRRLRLFGSVVNQSGLYKVYGFKTD